jgi:acyl transferase domain-containing protein
MKESISEDIAIIGMTGRFPGAPNVDDFWRNLVGGVESISTFSDEELAASGLDVAALRKDPNYVPARGILENVEWFDAAFFGMNAKQAEVTDPQQRLFLEASWEALENAGYDPARMRGPVGVYAGMGESTYYLNNLHSRADLVDLVGERVINLGNEKDFLATWVAYKLNLRGPAISVNTACSTSLVAVCQACQSLLDFQCDLALAGGVWISFPQRRSILFQDGGIFSPDGHCRTFDARAQGTVSSDGIGIVVLKRLAEALDDGDHIYAVIKGCGLNNDGSDKVAFTAPSVDGQAEAVATALAQAEFDPGTVSYIECHGTATPIGDPIEIAALAQAFRLGTAEKNFCAIGSVKSNIGHLSTAAGAAGLIKTALALQHKILPPTLHFTQPNPKIDFANSPFFVNSTLRKWENVPLPRRAGVSSFGLGGTNAHVALEEAPAPSPSSPSREWQLLLLSAKTGSALDAASANFLAHLKANPELNLADAAFTLQEGRQVFPHRRMFVCRDIEDAIGALGTRDPKRVITHQGEVEAPSVVFMFPGQGSQYVNMGVDLYRTEAVFKKEIDRCSELLLPSLGLDLREVLYPAVEKAKDAEELLTQTRITQPALFVIEYALATLWMSWGIKPAALIGHSIGEYVAACLAGVFSLKDALALVVRRGGLMQKMARGTMLAVPMPEDELVKILPATLSLATVNGPSQCVVSGPTAEVDAFLATLTASGKTGTMLHTSHAFHSAMMEPILQAFTECVNGVKRGQPNIPFLSNLTGTWISGAEATDPEYWAKHLRHAVRFEDGIKELLKNPDSVLLEVGPGSTLSSLVKRRSEQPPGRAIVSSLRGAREQRPDVCSLLTALGQLWLHGVNVDWSGFHVHERRRRMALPTYPFQRERYWIDAQMHPRQEASSKAAAGRNPDPADWFYLPAWKPSELSMPSVEKDSPQQKFQWLIFLDDSGLGEKLAGSLALRQESVTRVVIGPGYRRIDDALYAINPERPGDYDSLICELCASGKAPDKIVHLWSLLDSQGGDEPQSSLESAQNLGLHSLLFLARALSKSNVSAKLNLEVVTKNVHLVNGEEKLSPEKATVGGACKIIPLEYPNVSCRGIDIIVPDPGTKNEQRLLKQLLKEFSTKPSETTIAYRGGARWIESFEQIHLEPPAGAAPRLKVNGVYLITGGLGGIGLALAEYLATSVQAKLILVGRSVFLPREQWADWIANHDDEDETSGRIKKIQFIENAGADVLTAAADVADLDRMREVIDLAKSRFGHIDGVIHAAGNADHAGVIQRRTREATEEILAAKVKGTLVLDALLANSGLDFLVLCSTRSTVAPGGSFGQVGYIAANEFLDAFAFYKRTTDDVYTVAIDWDPWRDVGMAARSSQEQARAGKTARALTSANSLSTPEGAEAFNCILKYDFPRIVVSVADLHALRKKPSETQSSLAMEQETDRPKIISHPRPEVKTALTAPTNELEQALATIWQGLLGIQEVGAEDNFFDLGGDSLLLMRVQLKIRQAFGTDLSSAEMFKYPTVSALAQRLSRSNTKPAAKIAAAESTAQRTAESAVESAVSGAIPDRAPLQKAASDRQPDVTKDAPNAIAIIGMSGRFPGAANVDEFWRNLVAGVESASIFSDEELAASGLDVAAVRKNPNCVASRGIVEKAEWFDAAFFNISATEAEVIDPQQRLFLEASWEALENAGYDSSRFKGSVGVFAGMGNNTYYLNNLHAHSDLIEKVGRMVVMLGNEKDYVATRTAYKLNLKGPALSINTACSTSLVTVCLACQALLGRQCDLALAGGVSISFPQRRATYYEEGGIFSPDGHCRPFDAQSAGTYFSDGLGVVALKRLGEALKDGDQIYAVIKGVAFNNDGADKVGFTAPGVQGQAEAITLAQAHAGVKPDTISYIEAHGTATALGDPIEIAALTQAFQADTSKKNFCAIGSVKGNIGHLDAAAGVTGLIKTALSLKHKMLPATLHFTMPNPKIDFANSPFFVNSRLTEWKSRSTPRRAGVSAFGLGGTNAHVVLEETPATKPSGPSRSHQLLLFSAKTASALDAATTNFLAHLKANPDLNLADAAFTLQVGRRAFPHRRMLVCRDVADAIQALETGDPKRVITKKAEAKEPSVTFEPSKDQETSAMLSELGRLWLAGKPIDWLSFYAHEQRHRISLPTYPFQRERYWIEPQHKEQQRIEPETAPSQTMRHARPEVDIAFTPSTNESQRALAGIWQELLGIQEVGVDDNFFDLGGDSLLLLRVQAKIREALGTELSPAEMFEHPTIRALARHLSQPAAGSAGLGSIQDRAQMQRAAMARQRQPMKRG